MLNDTISKAVPFINKRSQFKFISHFFFSVLIGAAIAMAIFYLVTYKELGNSHPQALITLLGARDNLLWAMAFTGGIVIIFAAFTVLMITLINSNRIAGPVYRLERSLESLGGGDLSMRTRFRRHDSIKGLADEINSAGERLSTVISDIGTTLKEIRGEAERLRRDQNKSKDIIVENVRLAKKKASGFKTE